MSDTISLIKQQRARKDELNKRKQDIINKLPTLNRREIRRFRIPYHEALALELEEDGYEESASFFRELILFQACERNEAGPESFTWFYPQLINEKDKLDILQTGLRDAEQGKLNGKRRIECGKLLELAIYFSNQPVGWWWLARQLFLQATICSEDFREDGRRSEATIRYIFGRFYLNQLNEVENAIEQLKLCREISVGKPKWKAEVELGIAQKSIYIECCALLYRALLIIAKAITNEDPAKAARLSQIATNRAKNAEDRIGVSECTLHLAICELKSGNANIALIKFNRTLTMSISVQSEERICEARIHIAMAHFRLGNMAEACEHLESLLEYSANNNLQFYYAQAHRYLGELYLNKGQPYYSTPLLIKAVELFHGLNDFENGEQVKNLAAVSAGQELLPQYIKLILSCENHPNKWQNIIKLIRWKDSRKLFFKPEEDEKYSSYVTGEHFTEF